LEKPGVIWYRVADETHNGDGRHTSYLKKSAKSVKDKSVEDGIARKSVESSDSL
jgi:hypothetical protein